MTVQIVPAAIAVILGLIASGAVDATYDGGGTHGLAWAAFALILVLVARDTLLGGNFLAPFEGDEIRKRLPLQLSEGRLQIRVWHFEPITTTLAILLGLLASQAIDFRDGGNNPNGEITSVVWAAFVLSLLLTIGIRLSPRPGRGERHRQRRERRREERRAREEESGRRGDDVGDEIEARFEEIFDDLQQRFRRQDWASRGRASRGRDWRDRGERDREDRD